MTIPLQTGIIYGPLNSRRFGKSLGINLLPADQKVCSFDCVYCQYDQPEPGRRIVFPSLERIKEEVGAFFSEAKEKKQKIDWITIAGNGEPTLHPQFSDVVEALIELRDKVLKGTPIGILSNSTTCHRAQIHESLLKLDGCFMKLDAGSENICNALNHPKSAAQWEQVIQGLRQLTNITLQSMFIKGTADNSTAAAVEEWIKQVDSIKPKAVQIYTIDRSPRDVGIQAVSKERLEEIGALLTRKTGVEALVF